MKSHVIINRAQVKDDKFWEYLKSISVKSNSMTESVINSVSEYLQTSKADIVSSSRKRAFVIARQYIAFTCYKILQTGTYESIGDELNKDHASVIHYLNNFLNQYKYDQGYKEQYDEYIQLYYPNYLPFFNRIISELNDK